MRLLRWTILIMLLILFLVHPWLFGLRGIVGAAQFEAGLPHGLTRYQAFKLWRTTGGNDSGYSGDHIDYRFRIANATTA